MCPAPSMSMHNEVCLFQALPQWSQQALQQHMGDAREVKTLEQLENGGTGDAIWDAMQHQLKTYGTISFTTNNGGSIISLPSKKGM